MEKSIFKKQIILLLAILFINSLFAQFADQDNSVQIKVWAELDPVPGIFIDDENTQQEINTVNNADTEFDKYFKYAINKVNNIAPFLVNGMLNGFTFDYVPSDKKRNVAEIWTFTENFDNLKEFNDFEYVQNSIKDNTLEVWILAKRSESQKMIYDSFKSVNNPKIKGEGSVSIEKGTEGIKEAVSLAARDAVRKYYTYQIREKPKEVTGKVIIVGEPRVYIKSGRYFVELDFFLQTDKITMYKFY